jgi:hypothetical protein
MSSIAKRDIVTAPANSIGTDAIRSIGVAESLFSLTAQHDFIRPLAQLIQEGLKLLETSTELLISREHVEKFQLTLADAASITEEAVLALVAESDNNSLKMHVVKTFVAEVESILEEVVQALEALKVNECMKDRHRDSVSSSTLRDDLLDCENRLRRKFEDLKSALLSEAPLRAPGVTCTNIMDSQPCCHDDGGLGLGTLPNEDQAKIGDVSNDEKLGKNSSCD